MIDSYWIHLAAALVLTGAGVMLATRATRWVVKKTSILDERREETFVQLAGDVYKYTGVLVFLLYAVSPFFDLSKIVAGMGVLTVIAGIAGQSLLKDVFIGVIRLAEKQIQHGDYVTLNGVHKGTLEEIGIRFVKIRQWDGHLLTVSHGDVKEIQNGNREKRRVIEKIVLNYRENPEHAIRILQMAANRCNEVCREHLLLDREGKPEEAFQVFGITNLNAQFHGIEYAITGLVSDESYFEAAKAVRHEMALAAFQNDLKMAEANVYYRTRLNTNEMK